MNRSVLDRAFGPLRGAAANAGIGAPRRSEIFVDVVERLTVTFNSAGYVSTAEVDGAIQCKSFLTGNPQARMKQHSCVIGIMSCTHVMFVRVRRSSLR